MIWSVEAWGDQPAGFNDFVLTVVLHLGHCAVRLFVIANANKVRQFKLFIDFLILDAQPYILRVKSKRSHKYFQYPMP